MSPRAILDGLEKRPNILPQPRCDLRTVHDLTYSYTDYAGPTPVEGQYVNVILCSACTFNVNVLSNVIIEDSCPLVCEISFYLPS